MNQLPRYTTRKGERSTATLVKKSLCLHVRPSRSSKPLSSIPRLDTALCLISEMGDVFFGAGEV